MKIDNGYIGQIERDGERFAVTLESSTHPIGKAMASMVRNVVAVMAAILAAGCSVSGPTPFDGRPIIWSESGQETTISVGSNDYDTCMTFRNGRPVPARLGADGKFHCHGVDVLAPAQ